MRPDAAHVIKLIILGIVLYGLLFEMIGRIQCGNEFIDNIIKLDCHGKLPWKHLHAMQVVYLLYGFHNVITELQPTITDFNDSSTD